VVYFQPVTTVQLILGLQWLKVKVKKVKEKTLGQEGKAAQTELWITFWFLWPLLEKLKRIQPWDSAAVREITHDGTKEDNLQEKLDDLKNNLQIFRTVAASSDQTLDGAKGELSKYMQDATDYMKSLASKKKYLTVAKKNYLHPDSLLEYWKDRNKKFPVLYKLATDAMLVPTSSCSIERAFSVDDFLSTSHKKNALPQYRALAVMSRFKNQKRRAQEKNRLEQIVSIESGTERDAGL
jgi:hypothetical protein